MKNIPERRSQRGYALLSAIIFVVLLTVIALTALKSSGLEAKMGANNTLHTQAFEASETVRRQIEALIDSNLINGGWPATAAGGTIPDTLFDSTTLGLFTAPLSACTSGTPTTYGYCLNPVGSAPNNWYVSNTECSNAFPCAKFPGSLDVDATYSVPLTSTDTTHMVKGSVAVYRLNTALAPGNNGGFGCGSLGVGNCTSRGGSYVYYYINGHGQDLGSTVQAGVDTSTIFRDVVRN